jgi:hypothetical protein
MVITINFQKNWRNTKHDERECGKVANKKMFQSIWIFHINFFCCERFIQKNDIWQKELDEDLGIIKKHHLEHMVKKINITFMSKT